VASQFFVMSGRAEPIFLVDETGESARFDTLEAAQESARDTVMCQAFGCVIIEWDEHGYVETHDA